MNDPPEFPRFLLKYQLKHFTLLNRDYFPIEWIEELLEIHDPNHQLIKLKQSPSISIL